MMTDIFSLFLAHLLTFGVTANAALHTSSELAPQSSLVTSSQTHIRTALPMDGLYRFTLPTELLPQMEIINGQEIVSPERETVTFEANEPVAVEFLEDGQVLVHILLPTEEIGIIPEAIVISGADFDASGLRMFDHGGFKDLAEKYSAEIETQIASRGGFSRRGRAHYRNSAGGSYYGCVASVCRAIGGCTGTTGNGKGMTNYLRARGWRSVSCSNPPIGAVASWTGGSHGLGHTGRWNGRGWCYDLGCGDPGSKYRLKDCVAR